jgi:hypothetical protein
MIIKRMLSMAVAVLCVAASLQAQESLTGSYVADAGASDDIHQRIDEAIHDFNFIKRAVARKRLRAVNPPVQALAIKLSADSVEVITDGATVLRTPANGDPIPWRYRGEDLRVSSKLEGGTLITTFVSSDGERQNHYTLMPDGSIELRVRLSSPQLKRAVEYRRVFRRVRT